MTIKSTIKVKLALRYPPPAIITLDPMVSSGTRLEKSKYPPLEVTKVDAISTSLES